MKNFLYSLVSTNSGWVVRQVLKFVTIGATALTTWLTSKGFESSQVQTVVAGVTAGVSGALELVLSKVASKIAAK